MSQRDRPCSSEELDALRSRIAEDNGLTLYKRYTEEEAAGFLGVHPQTLKKKRLAGQIDCIKVSKRKISYFGFHVANFLISSTSWQHQNRHLSRSAGSGLVARQTDQHGIATGGTQSIKGQDALRYAQKTLKKQKNG
ncbi:MAG: hypothetical protein AAF498_02035 [Pseudomonadota bacterium]